MAKQILTSLDLLSLPSLTTPKTGSVGFGAKSDGLYQKVGTVETKLSIDGHTHTIAQITGLQGALDSKATPSDIDTAVNNLEIGGRNLISNSGLFNNTSNWMLNGGSNLQVVTKDGFKCLSATGSVRHTDVPLENGTEYVYSAEIMFDRDVSVTQAGPLHYWVNTPGQPGTGGVDGSVTLEGGNRTLTANTWHKIVLRFKTKPIGDFVLRPFIYKNPMPETWWLKYIKLEKGNKATDWTPAPEDQVSDWNESNASSFSFIKNKPTLLSQFTDNIGVASHIANKANPHNVTTAQIGAVDLTTNQTITGAKTFNANITLGVNRYIVGTDNYAGVWNVDDLLWRFGSRKTGSVANIRSEKVGIGTDNPLYKLDVLGTGRFTGNVTAPTFSGSLSGNASSATKLQTARTIAGVSFDGTANIDIPFANLASKPTTLAGYGITDGALKSLTLTAGNGLTGGGTLEANRTFALGTPSTLTAVSTNAVTATSHTHAITTTTVGAANTIVATDASGAVRGNIIRIGANWTLELSGTELVFKYNGVIKQRMLSTGTILATGGITALATS